jgi:hypothetical protein
LVRGLRWITLSHFQERVREADTNFGFGTPPAMLDRLGPSCKPVCTETVPGPWAEPHGLVRPVRACPDIRLSQWSNAAAARVKGFKAGRALVDHNW